jgi:hypothetical protein
VHIALERLAAVAAAVGGLVQDGAVVFEADFGMMEADAASVAPPETGSGVAAFAVLALELVDENCASPIAESQSWDQLARWFALASCY